MALIDLYNKAKKKLSDVETNVGNYFKDDRTTGGIVRNTLSPKNVSQAILTAPKYTFADNVSWKNPIKKLGAETLQGTANTFLGVRDFSNEAANQYYGNSPADTKKLAGMGAKSALDLFTLGYGGGAAESLYKQGVKTVATGQIPKLSTQIVKNAAKMGRPSALIGGGYGAADSLEKGDSTKNIILNTAKGAAAGYGLGSVLGGGSTAVGALNKAVRNDLGGRISQKLRFNDTPAQNMVSSQPIVGRYGQGANIKVPGFIDKVKSPFQTPQVMRQVGEALPRPGMSIQAVDDPLLQEARKYKSAEEFVEAQTPRVGGIAPELQGQTLYRGMSEGEWQAIQSGGVSGKASKGGRTFLTTEKQTADMAVEAGKGNGVVVELKPEAGQKVISGGKIGENTGGNLPGEYQARDIGIDDIAKVTDGNGKVIYEATTGGKTKSQLTDLYNKAQGGNQSETARVLNSITESLPRPGMNIQKVGEKPKERGFVSSVKNAPSIAPEIKQGATGTYTPQSNQSTIENATQAVDNGFEEAIYRAKNEDTVSREIQAESLKLVDKLQSMGRYQDAIDIVEKTAERATRGGQATQILAAFNRLTPDGVLMFAQRTIDRAKKQDPAKYGQLSITPEKGEILRKMATEAQGLSGSEKALANQKIIEEIERMVPSPWAKKLTTLWKAGLLTGVKGAFGGNTIGNTAMAIMKKVSDIPATGVDMALSQITGNRSKTFSLRGLLSGAGDGAKVGFNNFRNGTGKDDLVNKLDYQKTYYSDSMLGKGAQKYTDAVFNFYSGADKPFYHSALKNSVADQAKAEGINRGLKGSQLSKFIKQQLEDPSDSFMEQAVKDAEVMTFQNKNALGSALSGFKQGLKNKGGSFGEISSELIAPFTGVPSAIATAVYKYSPPGALHTTIRAISQSNKTGMTPEIQRQLSEGLGKGITGTGVIWLGMKLTESGNMTLGYPKDANERALWEQEGKIPYAVKINGKWRSLNYLGPIMSLMAIGGQMQSSDSVTQGGLASASAILASSPLQGMQAGLDAVSDPQRYGDSYLRNTVSSAIPTIVKDTAVAFDPTQREVNTVSDAFQSKIPGLRNSLLPKRDFLGQELPRNTTAIGSIIDPLRSSQIRGDELTQELRRLQDADFGPSMSKPKEDQKIFGENFSFTPKELDSLEQYSGGNIKKDLDNIIKNEGYKSLSDEEKKDYIDSIVKGVRKDSKENFVLNDKQPMTNEQSSTRASTGTSTPKTTYEIELAKKQFENSNETFKDLGDYVLRKNAEGTVTKQKKSAYESQVSEATLTSLKKKKDVKGWLTEADKLYQNLNKQLQDPSLDGLEKIQVQNKIDTLEEQFAKYKGYGGFTKGRSGGSKKDEYKSITGIDSPSALIKSLQSKFSTSKVPTKLPNFAKGGSQVTKRTRKRGRMITV